MLLGVANMYIYTLCAHGPLTHKDVGTVFVVIVPGSLGIQPQSELHLIQLLDYLHIAVCM